jgi:hypothetical protein
MVVGGFFQEGMCSSFSLFPSHLLGPEVKYNEETEEALARAREAYSNMDIQNLGTLNTLEERTIAWKNSIRQANKNLSQEQLEETVQCSEVSANRAYAVAVFAVAYGVATDQERELVDSLIRCGARKVGFISLENLVQHPPLSLPEWN